MEKKIIVPIAMVAVVLLMASCSIQYGFKTPSTIDYSKVKTITLSNFTNNAALVYAPMATMFNNQLQDVFTQQTKLQQVRRNGDLQIEGEISNYALSQLSVGENALAQQTRLDMSVHVIFTNRINPEEDFDKTFSANRTFDNTNSLNDVQEDLVKEMVEELVDDIYNATVANW